MFRITFFGTGNGLSYPNRENTFFLVQHLPKNSAYLVDCGGSPWAKLVRAGVGPEDLKALLITHGHADHTYGLPALIQSLWLAGRKSPLPIYCPSGAEKTIQGLLDLFHLPSKPNMFEIIIQDQPLERETEVLTDGGLRITTFPALHGIPTMGMIFYEKIRDRTVNVVYSADTVYNPMLETLAHKATCLIHECNGAEQALGQHSSMHDVVRLMKKTEPEQVVLVHLTEGENYSTLMEKYDLKQPKFLIAEDGMSLRIS
ncbi:ribonuclease Z [Heliorestis acidaminivorans]|uniref:Ribonuclease Z n=1 Tax=Heliorestis acidaminivorans TaxID=553427 RepID=A0A6I0F227_9FIRM|nr:ribonuclease Z [Heliorestis acidaminivorans]KAB2952513.1 ribonuclease Z [Heliorestis acidaminivorans]